MPVWALASLWGLLAASSLLFGAALAFLLPMPRSVTAGICHSDAAF
jgi:zinc transporter, ZIP family